MLSLDTTADQAIRTFDPVLPDTSQIVAFGCIAALTAAAVYVWANEVVRRLL